MQKTQDPPYKYLQQLSQNVFKIQYQDNKQTYALKKIRFNAMHDNDDSTQILIKKLNQLQSIPSNCGIIQLKKILRIDYNTYGLIMEFADKGNLQQQILELKKQNKRFEEIEIWFILILITKNLEKFYQHFKAYQDLKPENIFLYQNRDIKLKNILFPSIKKIEQSFITQSTEYMAPELIQGEQPNIQSDIWSIGIILYELCALQNPFLGKYKSDTFQNILQGEFHPISNIYSARLRKLIYNILQNNPNQRPSLQQIQQQFYEKMVNIRPQYKDSVLKGFQDLQQNEIYQDIQDQQKEQKSQDSNQNNKNKIQLQIKESKQNNIQQQQNLNENYQEKGENVEEDEQQNQIFYNDIENQINNQVEKQIQQNI
ncbi:Protein kinase-like domain [Pseudocohnilembus persalinus]|uniref:non-specific serine/threonine protein kinase n=1 Tax=Pseudocohnilembus persalinus TaxID=266149 RepID=A0A0V0QX74_PSEPJ|nr:Protein kinase-like domain [Pseudocohnilembus persalinus]|eukprot:KRX06666.1 Protein kinase-like domain [Pseudocohnilembus persalinus]